MADEKKSWKRFFTGKNAVVLAYLLLVIVTGTVNNVLAKIMSGPMGKYQYFLSNFTALAYVFFYGFILAVRYCMGIVTMDMLKYRKSPFVLTGFMDGLGNILGTLARPHLSGDLMPLLAQGILVFSMIAGYVILKIRYSLLQVCGALFVLTGAMISLIPTLNNIGSQGAQVGYSLMYTMSTAPNAISFSIKELVFKDFPDLDIFIVSFFGSFFQLVWTVILIPLNAVPGFGSVALLDLPEFFRDGMLCFVGQSPNAGDDCTGNPYAPLLYIVVNLCFNVSLLLLLKKGGALLMFIGIKACVPFSAFAFMIDWPLLPGKPTSAYVYAALVYIMGGLVVYRYASIIKEEEKEAKTKAVDSDDGYAALADPLLSDDGKEGRV